MNGRVKYPPVDSKSVDGASREEQKSGVIDVPEGPRDFPNFFFTQSEGLVSKGVPQDAKGGFVGRPHGWER